MGSVVICDVVYSSMMVPIELLAVLFVTFVVYIVINQRKTKKKNREVFISYDPFQNVFCCPPDMRQRYLSYNKLYDEEALTHGMVLDCEPVYFEWGGRRWLIEFWKGQYGVTTGAEIGAYSCESAEQDCEFLPNTDYLLDIKMELICDNEKVFMMQNRTWWLSGFVAGKFAQPSQLKLEVTLGFLVPSMAEKFVAELHQMGYISEEVDIDERTVRVTYSMPKSVQPRKRTPLVEGLMQLKNKTFTLFYRLVVKTRRYR